MAPREALPPQFLESSDSASLSARSASAACILRSPKPPRFLNGGRHEPLRLSPHRGFDAADDPSVRRDRAGHSARRIRFLWSACWTLHGPEPGAGRLHTLIVDTYVSNWLADGRSWAGIKEEYAREVLLKKLQQYAPNINASTILGSFVDARESLEEANPCFVDGTTNGGERIQAQLGYFRPFPGYAHYRSPIRQLYMTGPHCHPGGGISAAGTICANVMLEDFGMSSARDRRSSPIPGENHVTRQNREVHGADHPTAREGRRRRASRSAAIWSASAT